MTKELLLETSTALWKTVPRVSRVAKSPFVLPTGILSVAVKQALANGKRQYTSY